MSDTKKEKPMNCEKMDNDGAPCGTCRVCRAVEVRAEVNAVVQAIESDLKELRRDDMGREAFLAVNEAIFVCVKHFRR